MKWYGSFLAAFAAIFASCAGTVVSESVVTISGSTITRIDSGIVIGATQTDEGTLTRVAAGNGQIVSGNSVGVIKAWDTGLGFLAVGDVNGPAEKAVTALAAGSIGDIEHGVFAAHDYDDGDGNHAGANGIIFDSSGGAMTYLGSQAGVNVGVPPSYVDARIGDSDPDSPGNEVVAASIPHGGFLGDGLAFASGGFLQQLTVADGAFKNTGKGHGVNNYIAGIAIGPHGAETANSVIQFGASPWGGDIRPAVDHWQQFQDKPGAETPPQNFAWKMWHGGPNRAAIRDGAIGNLTTGGDPNSADFVQVGALYATAPGSNESDLTLSGNSIIEIQNTNSGGGNVSEITIEGETVTSMVLADLNDDGIQDIVVGAESGNVLVYSHTDLDSPFSLLGSINVGGPVTDMAIVSGAIVPEPATISLVLLGLSALFVGRRR